MRVEAVRVAVAVAAAGWLGACAGPRQIVEDRWDIAESSSAPEIAAIVDLGGGDVPLAGQLRLEPSDGVAVIGETLWIRGRGFGRQPSVMVGGRPAAVLARTRDGGIVVRVPPATPPGPQALIVSNEIGKGEKPVPVRRYAAVLGGEGDRIGWAEITAEGPIPAGVLPLPGARLLALSADGRAAYLADTRRSVIEVVEIPAAGAPRAIYRLDLGPEPVMALAAAARAGMVAVVRARDVVLLDTSSPLRPARSTPRALPVEVRDARIVAADLSPDGKVLAVAMEDGNRVALLDVVPHGRAPLAAQIAILPDARESLLCDVAFSPAGDTLWVAAGDTPRSRPSGPQPTQVFAVRFHTEAGGPLRLDVARVVKVEGASDPVRLSTGRALPLASGSAIRLPPERAPVFLSARRSAPSAPGTGSPSPSAPPAVIFRIGAEDAATPAAQAPGLIGLPDLTPDGRWLLAAVAEAGGSVRVLSTAVDGRPGQPRSVEVMAAPARTVTGAAAPPARAPQLRVQP